ncbi:MAG TPA: enoyl-CoA hydratase/isomerase family protein [Acidimicrobiia bacterium]|nr:enoyl-CoA hydratase/isomerase family protein [Acidimicrobiia bacterium]
MIALVIEDYQTLQIDRQPSGVTEVVLNNPERLNSVDVAGHRELTRIWLDLDADPETKVILLRAEGRAFSAGGDFTLIEAMMNDAAVHRRTLREARDLVRNLIECSKPIVSVINGVAVGAGLAAALLADIPIAGRSARILDGHTTLGVAAGDHAVLIWPLLVGMAKAKYHLLTNEPIDGTEAERLGLVAKVVDDDQLLEEARRIAARLAAGSAEALSWTKHTLNHWLRAAYPAFDASVAYEFLGFLGPDPKEGLAAVKEKRPPRF